MKPCKEIETAGIFQHTKEFDKSDLLIFERINYGDGGFSEKKYSYNSANKILKITETSCDTNSSKNTYEHSYDYNDENYRITTILKENSNYSDINTYENLVLGKEKWNKVDEVFSVQEFKYDKGNLINEKFINLRDNETYAVNYEYENNKLIKETRIENDKKTITKYIYENDCLIETQYYLNDKISNRKQFMYKNTLLFEENKYCYYNGIEYIAFKINFYYDLQSRILKKEFYGLFNSKMYLYCATETTYENMTVITKHGEIPSFDLGYYNLEELNQVRKNEMSEIELAEFKEYDENLSEDFKFKYDYYNVQKFDSRNNLLESISYNYSNKDEVYSRYFYHYEYSANGLLEMSLCFQIYNDYSIEICSTKKYYY